MALIYVDANIFITAFESGSGVAEPARDLFKAAHRQKLPDAIHAATALRMDCRYFCSSDRDSRRLPADLTPIRPDAAGISILLDALRS